MLVSREAPTAARSTAARSWSLVSHHPPTLPPLCPLARSFAFTIHGLWPQRSDGGWPEYCDPNNKFTTLKILDLLPRMLREWPSWAGPNAAFWAHEWSRHGACAQGVVGGERAFFKAVLDLHKSLNIQARGMC